MFGQREIFLILLDRFRLNGLEDLSIKLYQNSLHHSAEPVVPLALTAY